MPRGRRRRTPGLRREDAAALCAMSTAYYSRLERQCGTRPSPMMLASIARGRWFTSPAERRHFCPSEHALIGTEIAADLHHCLGGDKPSRVAVDLVRMLLDESAEFSDIWSQTTSATQTLASRQTCVVHSELGHVELHREVLADVESGLRLVIYLSTPGTAGHSKL